MRGEDSSEVEKAGWVLDGVEKVSEGKERRYVDNESYEVALLRRLSCGKCLGLVDLLER